MSKISNLKDIAEFLKGSENIINEEIHNLNAETSTTYKFIFTRWLDRFIKKSDKYLSADVLESTYQEVNVADEFAGIERFMEEMSAFFEGMNLKPEEKDSLIQPPPTEPEDNELEKNLKKAKVARQALLFSPTEEQKLYPKLSVLYEEQVRKRSWYQHDAFALVLGIILFPVAPLIYYLWKKDRDNENIQPNTQTEEEWKISKTLSKLFKEHVNTRPETKGTFTIHKNSKKETTPPSFITKYKKERHQFFQNHLLFKEVNKISAEEIQWVLNNKEQDESLHVSLGIQ